MQKEYKAYDGTVFNSAKEVLDYDTAALRKVSNDLWFVATEELSDVGFDKIQPTKYGITGFYHTADIPHLAEYFIACPIIYCRTKEAATLFHRLINRTPSVDIPEIKVGISFWFDDDSRFYQVDEFEEKFSGEARENLFNLINTIETFMENNS